MALFLKISAPAFTDCQIVIPAWFGRHFSERCWAPTPLPAFLSESSLSKNLKVREAIISFKKETEVWLPKDWL